MRVLLKSHNYLNILSHHNIYLKSTYAHKINTAIQPPSFHADLLALQQYLPPIKPLQVIKVPSNSSLPSPKKKKSKNASSIQVNPVEKSSIQQQKASKKTKKQAKSQQKTNKSATGKQTKKKSKKSDVQKQLKEDSKQDRNQNLILEQYPVLNFLKASLTESIPIHSKEAQTFNWRRKGLVYPQTADQRSEKFMDVLYHSMEKQSALRIIAHIEEYCEHRESNSKQNLEPQIFNKIKKTLEKELLLAHRSQSESRQYKSLIMNSLKDTNPYKINSTAFHRYMFFNKEQISVQEEEKNVTNKFIHFSSNFFKKLPRIDNPHQVKYRNRDALSTALRLKKSTERTSKQSTQTEPVVQVKLTSQNLLFKQVVTQIDLLKQQQSKKYAYIYDLPYGITQQDGQELVQYLQQTKGVKVKQYVMFPYKNVMKDRYQVSFHVTTDELDQQKIQKVYKKSDVEKRMAPKQKSNKKKKVAQDQVEAAMEFKSTDELLEKIMREDYTRFNKSTMVIKLENQYQKEKIVNRWTRLFGLNFKHLKNIKFQQAFCKTIVTVNNIPSGCTSSEILSALNKTLSQKNIKLSVEEDHYLSKQYITIQFSYFVDALQAVHLIHNQPFQGKHLNAELQYGPLKVFKDSYSASPQTNLETWQQIAELTEKMHLRFQQEDQELYQ